MEKYFPYGVVEPGGIPDIADAVLDEFMEIAKQVKVKPYLVYGLCLGFVRDGKYIAGDNDLDVAVILDNPAKRVELISLLKEHKFNVGDTYTNTGGENTHFYRDRILLDVFWRRFGEFYSGNDEVMYKGKVYPVPHPVSEYLSKCYTDWHTPCDEMTRYYG